MGGQTSSTPQIGASPMGSLPQTQPMGGIPQLASLFGGNLGYQQNPLPQIMAPQYPAALTPTPQQAAAQTVAQMNALRPYVPPPAPVQRQQQPVLDRGGNGSAGGRGSGGAW